MSETNLFEKFPEMRPMTGVPSLATVNGIGFSVYGSRDYDQETGTYVKTHCFCFLFVPLIAFRAYRVADGQRGWYFLGRVPLSPLARAWNMVVLFSFLGILGGWAWHGYTHSEKYLARQQMEEADHLAEAGQVGKAARIYLVIAAGTTEHATAATEKIGGLLGDPAMKAPRRKPRRPSMSPSRWRDATQPCIPTCSSVPTLWSASMSKRTRGGAVLVLDAIAPIAPDKQALLVRQQMLLEKVVAAEPGDVDTAVKLAVVYEGQGQPTKCEKLLAPNREKLGLGEGARVLGLVYAQQGKLDDAYALLAPYTEHHLKEMHDAEQALHETVNAAQENYFQQLKSNKAPGFDYNALKRASVDQQKAMVDAWMSEKLRGRGHQGGRRTLSQVRGRRAGGAGLRRDSAAAGPGSGRSRGPTGGHGKSRAVLPGHPGQGRQGTAGTPGAQPWTGVLLARQAR